MYNGVVERGREQFERLLMSPSVSSAKIKLAIFFSLNSGFETKENVIVHNSRVEKLNKYIHDP